jgi:hypothetical protein
MIEAKRLLLGHKCKTCQWYLMDTIPNNIDTDHHICQLETYREGDNIYKQEDDYCESYKEEE